MMMVGSSPILNHYFQWHTYGFVVGVVVNKPLGRSGLLRTSPITLASIWVGFGNITYWGGS